MGKYPTLSWLRWLYPGTFYLQMPRSFNQGSVASSGHPWKLVPSLVCLDLVFKIPCSGKILSIVLGHYSPWQASLAATWSQSSWALTLHTCLYILWARLGFHCISWVLLSHIPLLQLPHPSSVVKNFLTLTRPQLLHQAVFLHEHLPHRTKELILFQAVPLAPISGACFSHCPQGNFPLALFPAPALSALWFCSKCQPPSYTDALRPVPGLTPTLGPQWPSPGGKHLP